VPPFPPVPPVLKDDIAPLLDVDVAPLTPSPPLLEEAVTASLGPFPPLLSVPLTPVVLPPLTEEAPCDAAGV
jgi:hypothetical protein